MSGEVVAVTGASGFVGGVIARALVKDGRRVIDLGRRPAGPYEHREFALGRPVTGELLSGVDALVHCAYDLSLTDGAEIERVNVQGTRALVEAATATATRVLLVSSMSAYPGTRQIYGQAKLRTEEIVLASGGEAVRLGLVWGAGEGGMIGTLKRLAGLPAVPIFGRGLHQFMVHTDDVGEGFVKLLGAPTFGKPLGLAHPVPVPFEAVLAYANGGRAPRLVRAGWPSSRGCRCRCAPTACSGWSAQRHTCPMPTTGPPAACN
jgi:nucleoside-diphosphate-sugar epimerase